MGLFRGKLAKEDQIRLVAGALLYLFHVKWSILIQ